LKSLFFPILGGLFKKASVTPKEIPPGGVSGGEKPPYVSQGPSVRDVVPHSPSMGGGSYVDEDEEELRVQCFLLVTRTFLHRLQA